MDTNPVLKPKLATATLVLASAVVLFCVLYVVAVVSRNPPSNGLLMLGSTVLLAAAAFLVVVWLVRLRRRRDWVLDANEKWNHLNDVRRAHGTTTEITVLSVDALEPTGSWITIKWNRFDHIQRAWIEALPDSIWSGSVLLISPDPAQVKPGSPWPPTYYVRASNYLAWAPSRFTPPQ